MLRASSDWEEVILKPDNLKRQLNSRYQVPWSKFLITELLYERSSLTTFYNKIACWEGYAFPRIFLE